MQKYCLTSFQITNIHLSFEISGSVKHVLPFPRITNSTLEKETRVKYIFL